MSFWLKTPPVLDADKNVLRGGMFPHQLAWWESEEFFRVLVSGYGSGKTLIGAKWGISCALQNAPIPHLIISPSYKIAKRTIIPTLKSLLAGKERLLKGFRWRFLKTDHEFQIYYHGRQGVIWVASGDDPLSLRGPNVGSGLIDEPFIQSRDVFDQLIARVREPAPASAIGLTGCVVRDTWVCTNAGWKKIGDLDNGVKEKEYKSLDGVYTLGINNEYYKATKFYNNGTDDVISLKLTGGYEITATPDHPVLAMGADGVPVFKRIGDRKNKYGHLAQLQSTDRVAIARGMNAWGSVDPCKNFTADVVRKPVYNFNNINMSKQLAYFLGLWVAEGSLEKSRVTITCESAVIDALIKEGIGITGLNVIRARPDQCRVNSILLVQLMQHLQMPLVKAPSKFIPQWVFSGKREWALSFLAGMFDGDGHVCKTGGGIGYSTASEQLSKDLQILLLNIGVTAFRDKVYNRPSEKVKAASVAHHVLIGKGASKFFADCIPLRIDRKKEQLKQYSKKLRDSDCVPNQARLMLAAWEQRSKQRWRKRVEGLEPNILVRSAKLGSGRVAYSTLCKFVEAWELNEPGTNENLEAIRRNILDGYYWAEVRGMEKGRAETVDFVIPETHTFVSNGVLNCNTPEELNWGYDICEGEEAENFELSLIQASTRDNKVLTDSYTDRLEATLTEEAAKAYVDGSFVSLATGKIYYAFSDANVVQLPIPEEAELGAGMDFNVDPMAAVVFYKHKNCIHVIKEYELSNADTEYMCSILREHYGQRIRTIYPDATGRSRHTNAPGGQTDFHHIKRADFAIDVGPVNPKIRDRYNTVNGMMKPKDGPPRLTIDPSCKRLIAYLKQISHSNKKKNEHMTHLLDALGYPVCRLFPLKTLVSIGRLHGA